MEYAKLKPDNTFDYQISGYENVVWDESHFCSPSALTSEEAAHFQVVPLIEVPMPAFEPKTHKCFRDGVELVNDTWQYKWAIVDLSEEEKLANLMSVRTNSLTRVNSDDNKIYADVIGNKATEYTASEIAAQEYKDADYTGDVPELVQAWADAKLWTARQATDDILGQAAAWRQAASLIRRYRLKAKEDVKRATTIEEVEATMSIWNNFVMNIRTQLGVE